MTETTKPNRQQLLVERERAGAKMANTLFNLAQREGHTLTAEDIEQFDTVRRDWDRASGDMQQARALTGERPGGRAAELMDRLESVYQFQCEAGPLKNCDEWVELRKLVGAPAADEKGGA